MPIFDDTGWTRQIPVAVDNTAGAGALTFHQVDISIAGANFADWSSHGNADGSDLRVVDQDGTLLQHWREAIDATNSVVRLVAKVPAVAAGATRTLTVLYGNSSAADVSNPATTIGPSTALVGPADIVTQGDVAGYNDGSWLVRLQHQVGGGGPNGRILMASSIGQLGNPTGSGQIGLKHSDDGGVTWSSISIISGIPAASHGFSCQFLHELSSGKLLLCYSYDLNTALQTAKELWYVASSVDGGTTWTNLGTSPTNPLAVPWTYGTCIGIAYGAFLETTPGGNLLKLVYGQQVSTDAGWKIWLLRCPAGSDPTNGTNWVLHGLVAGDGTRKFGEPAILQTTDANHMVCVFRDDTTGHTGDFWRANSSDGGATWTAPVVFGLSGPIDIEYQAVSPFLYRLPISGNVALVFGVRYPVAGPWGTACLISTDNGATFLDRGASLPLGYAPGGTQPWNYGYPSIVQNLDGTLVVTTYREVGSGAQYLTNVARVICTEDWLVNSPNVYLDCESFTADWASHGANVTISADRSHSGAQCVKIDNTPGTGGTGVASAVNLWSRLSAGQASKGVGYTYWCYCSQLGTGQGYGGSVMDGSGNARTSVNVLQSTGHLSWYNGTAYQDTGLSVPNGAWHRVTARAALTGTTVTGTASVDGGTPASIGQRAAGGGAATLSLGAGSTVATSTTTVYFDDIYSRQYAATPPVVTPGAAQSAGIDLSGFDAGWTFSPQSGIVADGPAKPWNQTTPPSPPNFAFLTDSGTIEQQFTVVNAGVHAVACQSENRYFPAATQTVRVLIDGVSIGTIPANTGFAWVSRSFNSGSLSPGVHTLRFAGVGDVHTSSVSMLLDSVTITDPSPAVVPLLNGNFDHFNLAPDQYVYNPPAVAVASYRLAATVATCGKLLECTLSRISDGAVVPFSTINEAPIVTVNGVNRGAIRCLDPTFPMLATSAHSTFLVPLPAGVVLAAGDAVTLTAPEGWITGPAGYAEAMSGQAASNRVGVSFVRTVDVPRTMQLGASSYLQAEWHVGGLAKNWAKRCATWVPGNVREDNRGNPLQLGNAVAGTSIVKTTQTQSNIDATGLPTPAGYWAVRWNDRDGHSSASLNGGGAVNTSCVEVPGMANPGVGGLGRVRVFNIQPTGVIDAPTGQWLTNMQVWLQFATTNPQDPVTHGYPIAIDGVAVLSPGDFDPATTATLGIPVPAWDEVTSVVEAQLPSSLQIGPHRQATVGIQLGQSPSCEREDLCDPDDFRWNTLGKRVIQMAYTQARPWTNAASPYVYDPLTGTDYPASLTAPITTAPAAGTVETITLAQVGDGVILAGLVLTIDSEKFRVMATPTGPTTALVTSVMRGVNSTTPALHPIKTISVSARRPVADLTAWGPNQRQVTELVTQAPHGLKTGQIMKMDGGGFPPFAYTDGSGFYDGTFNNYNMPTYVTGPNTFVVTQPNPIGSGVPNVTLSAPYTLNPANCSSLAFLPFDGWVPYEMSSALAAGHPGAPARVTVGMVASDDMIDEIWRRQLPYLPVDRDIYAEVGDEEWNHAGTPADWWYTTSYQLYGVYSAYYWYGVRVGQIKARGRAIWAAAGRDPAHVKSTFNLQCAPGNAGLIGGLLDFLKGHGGAPDLVEIAPYYDNYPDPAMWKAYAAWSTDMLVDAWTWDLYRNASAGSRNWAGGQGPRVHAYSAAIDTWNAAQTPPGTVELGIYEYAPGNPWPVYAVSPNSGTVGLGAAMDATTTTLTLPNATARNPLDDAQDDCAKICPGTWLRVDSEWLTVVSRSGASCTVNRAQGGTTAAAHAAGTYLANDWVEGIRDITLHPNYRIAHYDALCLLQAAGVAICIPSSLNQNWPGGAAFADYHGLGQRPSRGNGSGGGQDNLLCLARPGQTHTKSPTVSQDLLTDSVRGQALIDFASVPMAPTTPTIPGVHRLLESGADRLLESGASRLLESPPPPTSGGPRLLEDGASRLLENGAIRLLEGVPVGAGIYDLSGPGAVAVGVASAPFTVSLTGGAMATPVTFTPHVAGVAGTFMPASVTIPAGSPSATFTFTPSAPGTATISTTNDSSLADPPAVTVVVTFAVLPATSYTLVGPSGATVGATSSPFAVSLVGGILAAPVTITPHVAGVAGTITPATLVIPAGRVSGSFAFTPSAVGTATISVTNGSALADPAAVTVACDNPLPPETFAGSPHVMFRPGPGPGFAKTFVPRRPPVRRVRRGR